jgi:ABC-type transporter Mla subunit MlaD
MTDSNFQTQVSELLRVAIAQNERTSRLEDLSLSMGRMTEALISRSEDHGDRMRQIENAILSLNQSTEDHGDRLNQLETFTLTMAQNVQTLNAISAEHQERMTALENQHNERMAGIEETNASLGAAIERLDRIMDRLINPDRPTP